MQKFLSKVNIRGEDIKNDIMLLVARDLLVKGHILS